ncbi:Uncharacterized protein Adt_39159 [Abeliophyllum distichum]|uniref:Uncharacterized protein n=1 Tax=Abeliophyllum distichum TaxID=126358 RepID=A0ABD1Q5Z9_9LAMI
MRDEVFINSKPIDTINIHTLKRMKIVKENGQWVATTKDFDAVSGPPHCCLEEVTLWTRMIMMKMMHLLRLILVSYLAHIFRHLPHPIFSFSEDHYNLFNGRIDSLTSTMDGLQHTVGGL